MTLLQVITGYKTRFAHILLSFSYDRLKFSMLEVYFMDHESEEIHNHQLVLCVKPGKGPKVGFQSRRGLG